MQQYTPNEYKIKFGEETFEEKVNSLNDGAPIESIYATDSGNVFMVILEEEA